MPLDATTMHEMMIENVNLPPILMEVTGLFSTGNPPPAIFELLVLFSMDLSTFQVLKYSSFIGVDK